MLPPDLPQMDVAAKDEPSYSFMVDEKDPVAHWLRVRLGWDWPQVLIAAFLIYGPLEKLIMPGFGN